MKLGKVAAIAGASSGAGRAMALLLAARGYPVAVCARRQGSLEELAGEIRAKGGKALAVPADMAK